MRYHNKTSPYFPFHCILRTAGVLFVFTMPCASMGGRFSNGKGEQAAFREVAESGTVQFRKTRDEKSVPKRFQMQPHVFEYKSEFLRKTRAFQVYHIQFASPVKTSEPPNNIVHAEYYQPAGFVSKPGCVLLHPIGDAILLPRLMAQSLAQQGIATLFVKMPYYEERHGKNSRRKMISYQPDEIVEGVTQAVLDIRRAAAWLEARPEVNGKQLGISGVSLGGMIAALAAEAEPRFSRVALHIAGGNIGPALWEHPDANIQRHRREWIAAGGTRNSFLKKISLVDPVTYGYLLQNRTVLIVAASRDEVIPPKCTVALAESISSRQKIIWLDAGHITSLMFLTEELVRLGRFLGSPELVDQTAN